MSVSNNDKSRRTRVSAILFDIRTIIGGLFVVYGVVCLIWGLAFDTAADRGRSGNINVNLWAGLGMLVLAAIMLAWSILRPITDEIPPDQQ